jgi:hypothetical protein
LHFVGCDQPTIRHDSHHKDIRHNGTHNNDTQHTDIQYNSQHNHAQQNNKKFDT